MPNKGKFIVLEGPDGSGKSTAAESLNTWLNEDIKQPTVLVPSPGGTTFANALRNLVFAGMTKSYAAEMLALLAAETDAFEEIIAPSLYAGKHVIGDRWLMSGRIYQSFLRNRPPDKINTIIEAAFPHPWTKPDLYIVLNAQPEVLLQRVIEKLDSEKQEKAKTLKGKGSAKKKEKLEQEGDAERQALEGKIDFYRRAWAAYAAPLTFSAGVPCVTLNTTNKTAEEISDRIREIVMQGVLSN